MFFQHETINEGNEVVLQRRETQKSSLLILASGSPGRKQVLENLGLLFQIDPANIDEESFHEPSAESLVSVLALEKAKHIAKKYKEGVVLAADTMISYENEIIGKPRDKEHAEEILTTLSSRTHQVITGLTLIDIASGKIVQRTVITLVTFHDLSSEEILKYIATGEPFGMAGAYAIQGEYGKALIKGVDGEGTNICGMPKQALLSAIEELGYCFVQHSTITTDSTQEYVM